MSSNVTGQQPCLFSEQASPFLSITSDLLFYFAKSPLSILSLLAAMGRITPTDLTLHKLSLLPFSPTVFITILAILAVLSTLVLLCGAHRALTSTRGNNVEQKKKNSVRLGGKKPARLHISKALLMAKLISWRKVQDEEEEEEEEEDEDHDDGDEQAIWKRTIIKGEKCRPLDFSGKILYDSNGNMIAAD